MKLELPQGLPKQEPLIKKSLVHLVSNTMHLAIKKILYNNHGDVYNYIQHQGDKVYTIWETNKCFHQIMGRLFSGNFLQNQGELAAM